MKKFFIAITIICAPLTVVAQTNVSGYPSVVTETRYTTAYEEFARMPVLNFPTPQVVEFPVDGLAGPYLVYEESSGSFIGSSLVQEQVSRNPYRGVVTIPFNTAATNLIDAEPKTFTEFSVQGEAAESTTIRLELKEPMPVSGLQIDLAPNVSLPLTVTVVGVIGEEDRVLMAESDVKSRRVAFPETTVTELVVTFTHIQPLRISDMSIISSAPQYAVVQFLRFLAQPTESYAVYRSPDRVVSRSELSDLRESGNLGLVEDVAVLSPLQFSPNQSYRASDVDADGIIDLIDNCVSVANSDQFDINQNGRGDACDDFDQDGWLNPKDNCPNIPNVRQTDTDGDGIGDECDTEESRFTEQNPWIPWVGIGSAGLVLFVLFTVVALQSRKAEEDASLT